MTTIHLRRIPLTLAVCKLETDALPGWAQHSSLVNFTKTDDEYSLVCEQRCVPPGITADHGWGCFKVDAVLDFSLVGIIAGLTRVLAAQKISVFVISTYDTDYLLVKQNNIDAAINALTAQGYGFVDAKPL